MTRFNTKLTFAFSIALSVGCTTAYADTSLIVDTTSAFFRIQEHTKSEYVAVGSDGNIRRWSATGGDEQLWLFIPQGGRSYRIITKQNEEYMSVGHDGNIRRWAYVDGNSQIFKLVNASGNRLNIQESTKDEFVAVGSNGNILRWSKTNNNDQLFTLIPASAAAKPDLPEVKAAPGEIPPPPELTSYDTSSLPTETAKVLVGASRVLATMVDDIAYSDKVEQMKNVPYYIATREQHWSRVGEHGYSYEHSQGETKTISRTVIYEVSQRSTASTEETWGTKFSINAEVSVSGKRGPASGTASAGMAAEFTRQLKISQVNESKVLSRSEVKIERVYDKSTPRFSIVGWSLIDTYTLRTPDGDVVSEAEAGYNNSLISKAYPRDLDVTLR